MPKINRVELQALARLRVQEAQTLLAGNGWSGAYHFSGLAVECAPKACIARQTDQHEFPDLDRAKRSWKHKPDELIKTAGLGIELERLTGANPQFEVNWLTLKDWDADSRYIQWSEQQARDMFL